MEIKTLTPVQLWQDFDNYCTPINMSIVGYNIVDNIAVTEYFFTAFNTMDGEVRVYAKTFCRPKSINNPTILFIDEFDLDDNFSQALPFINLGYTLVYFDYKGIDANKELYTHYPNSLDYGNYSKSGLHLNTAKFGAQHSSLFLWSKIARRTISFIESLPTCDSSRIIGISNNSGANILWQVAGTDNRLSAIIPIYNTGFSEYNGNTTDYSSLNIDDATERNRWVIGLAVPSYAKFVNCPVIFVGASNSRTYDYISLSNTINMLPSSTYNAEIITIGADKNLDYRTPTTIISMLDNINNGKENYKTPTLTRSINNGVFYYDINVDVKLASILKVELHLSYGDTPSAVRNWRTQSVGMGMDGNGRVAVKVYDLKEKVLATATIIYTNGVIISTQLDSFIPSNTSNDALKSIKNNRIIYERSLGTRAFFTKKDELIINPDDISLKNGPLDIAGLTSYCNELVCYNIGDITDKGVDNTLQFDCFHSETKTFDIKLTDINLFDYFATITIGGTDEWIKVTLDAQDFKDKTLKPLRTWADIKVVSFVNAENVLFNNIIWI